MLFASFSGDCVIDNASSKARSPAAWAQHGGAHAHWAFSVEPMVCLTPLYIYTLVAGIAQHYYGAYINLYTHSIGGSMNRGMSRNDEEERILKKIHERIIDSSFGHIPPLQKISKTSVHQFWRYPANRTGMITPLWPAWLRIVYVRLRGVYPPLVYPPPFILRTPNVDPTPSTLNPPRQTYSSL